MVTNGRAVDGDALAAAAAAVRASRFYDAATFAAYRRGSGLHGIGDVEAYLLSHGGSAALGTFFDGAFYTATYADVRATPAMAFLHFLEIGGPEGRPGSEAETRRRIGIARDDFDARHYLMQTREDDALRDPVRHYILHGERRRLEPSAGFSPEYYVRRYPDVAGTFESPFVDFLSDGINKGRRACCDAFASLIPGRRTFDPTRPTAVVSVHDASLSGAPVLGLALCRAFAKTHNVVVTRNEGGPLTDAFLAQAIALMPLNLDDLDADFFLRELRNRYGADLLIANSAMTSEYAFAALHEGIPSVALVHEHAIHSWPPGRVTTAVETADRVVVATGVLRETAQAEVIESRGGPANNISVHAQGHCPPPPRANDADGLSREQILQRIGVKPGDDVKIVLGAGTVEMRKGVDLFVRAADRFRSTFDGDFRFVWIGGGYRPRADQNFSTWVAQAVRRLGLEDRVFFFDPQPRFETFLHLSDVLFVSSRLDPLPNTAIDALKAKLPIVCFQHATGLVSILRRDAALGEVVPYCDVDAAAGALARRLSPEGHDLRPTTDIPELDFAAYFEHVAGAAAEAVDVRATIEHHAARIDAAAIFDDAFHDGVPYPRSAGDRKRAALVYAARSVKGLLCLNPRPGVHQGRLRERAGSPERELELLADDVIPATHRCIDLRELPPAYALPERIALHVHLHYSDLATDFLERLEAAGIRMDLVLTTTSATKAKEIAAVFRTYSLGAVEVIAGPNRGRDVGPLLVGAGRALRAGGYDVIGHLHGKRSLQAEADHWNTSVGERWRRHLLALLLGDRATLHKVLGLFAREPELGLVFPEDRHCVGWQGNVEIARELAARMHPRVDLPVTPVFPIGTMFWCRPETLVPFWDLGFTEADFPVEPLAYDGTLPHAIEAMIPAVCESVGFAWATLFDRRFAR